MGTAAGGVTLIPQPRPCGSKPAASHNLRISEISLVTLGRVWTESRARSLKGAWSAGSAVVGRYITCGSGRR